MNNKLLKKAKENSSVAIKNAEGTNVVEKGVPNDHFNKREPNTVGISLGVTLNMGDYESMRADVWVSDNKSDKETYEEALNRIQEVVEKRLEEIVSQYRG